MSKFKKWFECNQCAKRLSSYKSLWRHKKICNYSVDDTSTLDCRSAICSQEQNHLIVGNENAKLDACIDQIINGSSQVIEQLDKDTNKSDNDISLPFSNDLATSESNMAPDNKNEQFEIEDGNMNQEKMNGNTNENEHNTNQKVSLSKESKNNHSDERVITVYGIEIPDKALTNFELSKYCNQLNIRTLRGIYARDSLPAYPQKNECGIVNLNTSSEPGSHWVCYFKTGTDRIYFDSYGQVTPYEVQKYLKTLDEVDKQVIKRNTDIVQAPGTKICGHLCLYVLKSLSDGMKFHKVLENLSSSQQGEGIQWTDELANELHKPLRHKFQKRYVFAQNVDDIWAADLVDMRALSEENDNYNYILMIIDVLSKYAWARPLQTKSGKALKEALEDIFKEGNLPKKIWADRGTEFYNKNVETFLLKHKISLYSTGNPEKSSVVERWNRTIKTWLWKYFTANGTHKYIDVLQALVKKYNSKKHHSTKLTPIEARQPSNYVQLYRNLYLDKLRKLMKR